MRILAFDGRMGASGDMVLGALVNAGADPAVLSPVEAALDVTYRIESAEKCGISATAVSVRMTGPDDGDGHSHPHDEHSHHHDGHDEHSHHPETDGTVPAEGHGPARTYTEVCEIVDGMAIDDGVKADALAIFEALGTAEAAVHGTDLDDVHFHEVGADDAIADVVGTALLMAELDPDRIVTTALSAGRGTVRMSHGEYPVPAPAVTELATMADWSLRGGPVDRELLTPTGAAIFAHYADGVENLPPLSVESVGYGAGGYDLDPHPNVLRVLVGDGGERGSLAREDVTVLETNLDDATPEVLGGLQEVLSTAGALDVSVSPLTMKKSRPGHLVRVVCKPADRVRLARTLADETGTLGVRETGVRHRWVADRELERVTLEYDGESYDVAVKVAADDTGVVYDVSAEYDDAAAVAEQSARPVRSVIADAERIVRESTER